MRKTIVRIVAYIRVSGKKQGKSGLGLEAQREMVERFRQQHGAKLVQEFIEVETATGKRNRPELMKAIARCKSAKATLVVAKLDRLARNVAFTSALMESKVDFICCDNPDANQLVIHILAAVAENEARAISERTREALAALKRRGKKLGAASPNSAFSRGAKRGFKAGNKASALARTQRALDAYRFVMPKVIEMQKEGHSLDRIAAALNDAGYRTQKDQEFRKSTVHRIVELFKREGQLV